ncbi:hypothetical protein [Sulfurimonas sp.]
MKYFIISLFLVVAFSGCGNEVKTSYYSDGDIMEKAEYDENGKYDGLVQKFYNNKVREEIHYKHGIKDGEKILYRKSNPDVVSYKIMYVMGKKSGMISYDKNGNVTSKYGYYEKNN